MNKSMINVALAVAFGASALSAQAATTLGYGDNLSITAGIPAYVTNPTYDGSGTITGSVTVQSNVTKSWFAMNADGSLDANGKPTIAGGEKVALQQGTTGITIGYTTTGGGSHPGAPVNPADAGAIDAGWNFFGNTGTDFVTTGITGYADTTAALALNGIDMSGWSVTWAGIPLINMGSGAWGANANGKGTMVWSGVYGATYKLDYTATVPLGDPSGFGGVAYQLHLEGVVSQCTTGCTDPSLSQVPVPAAAWLLGSGLLGLVGVARRRKQVA